MSRSRVAFAAAAIVLSCALPIWALTSPVTLLVFVAVIIAVSFLRRRSTERLLTSITLALVTLSLSISTLTLGPLPIAVVLLAAAGVGLATDIAQVLRSSSLARWLSAIWLAWLLWTSILVLRDYPVYGFGAFRDAIVVVCFGAVLVGFGIAQRIGPAGIIKFVHAALAVGALYIVLYVVRGLLPAASLEYFKFANVGLIGLSCFWAGLISSRRVGSMMYLSAGALAILVSQGRMIYLAAIALTALYLLGALKHEGHAANGGTSRLVVRLGRLAGGMSVAFVILSFAYLFPAIEGRLGAITPGAVIEQLQSVLVTGSTVSGSVQDRDIWWSAISDDLQANNENWVYGLGMGSDLLHGYRSDGGELVRKPHNDYLEMVAREGVLGMSAMLFSIVSVVPSLRRMSIANPELSPMFAWFFGAVLTAFAQPYLSYPHGAALLSLIAGCAVVLGKPTRLPQTMLPTRISAAKKKSLSS
ncbi:hypothetical protein ACWEQ4_03660 [Rhodococcus sp. NPDC003994]